MSDRTTVMYYYDGTYNGFLSCVFESFAEKRNTCRDFCPLMKPTRRVYSARSISRPTCVVPSVCACRFRRKWAWRRRIF